VPKRSRYAFKRALLNTLICFFETNGYVVGRQHIRSYREPVLKICKRDQQSLDLLSVRDGYLIYFLDRDRSFLNKIAQRLRTGFRCFAVDYLTRPMPEDLVQIYSELREQGLASCRISRNLVISHVDWGRFPENFKTSFRSRCFTEFETCSDELNNFLY
jgi:hypothetical protein